MTNIAALVIGLGVALAAVVVAYVLWLRPWQVRWGATDAELERGMPGDDIIKNPIHVTTRAITIRARPDEIWPWLVQMGYQRGGMYSYDWIDRVMGVLDRPSADRVIPEFQHLEVGDVIPLGTEPSWPVAAIETNRSLLVDIRWPGMHYTWSWGLYEFDERQTRLVLRIRTLLTKRWLVAMFHIADFGSFLMTCKHLLGVRDRAEAAGLGAGEPAIRHRAGACGWRT